MRQHALVSLIENGCVAPQQSFVPSPEVVSIQVGHPAHCARTTSAALSAAERQSHADESARGVRTPYLASREHANIDVWFGRPAGLKHWLKLTTRARTTSDFLFPSTSQNTLRPAIYLVLFVRAFWKQKEN